MTRIRRVLTGLGALVVLAALVVGVPWALWHFIGWPLPHSTPSLTGIGHDLSQRGIPDNGLVDALAVVVWIVWALLAVSVIAETVATARGSRASRLPLAGLFQPLTGRLIAAVLVAVLALAPRNAAPRPASSGLVSAANRPVATVVLTDAQLAATHVPLTPAASASAITEQATLTATTTTAARVTHPYVVQRGDTLWGIAKRELGDPLRWREIAELNEGRHEGTSTFGDPHWIYPGWTLLLPGEAAAPTVPATAAPTPQITEPAPVPPHGAHTQEGTDGQPAGNTASPATTSPVSINAPTTAHPAPPEAPTAAPHAAGNEKHADVNNQRQPVPIAPIGAGLLGVAVLGLLGGLRLAQQRHRRPGRRIALPAGSLADIERALAAGSNHDAATAVDRAIRLFGRVCREHRVAPTVLGAEVSRAGVCFLLEAPVAAEPPFTESEAGWLLDLSDPLVADALHNAADEPSLLPGFVTIGTDGGAIVLINLECGGTVAISGDAEAASEVTTAIALELAGASWVERAELYDVGIGTGQANPYRCTTLSSFAEGLELALAHGERTRRELERSGRESAVVARLTAPDEDWSPLLLISSESATDDVGLLTDLPAPERSALVIVAPGNFAAHWNLVAHDDGSLELPPLGRRVMPQRVSRQHLAGIASVLGLAAEQTDVAPEEEPYASIQVQADERVLPTEFGATDADTVEYDEVLAGDAIGQDIECEWTEEEVTDQAELFPNESPASPPTERDVRSVPSPSTVQVEVDVLGGLSVVGLARQPRRGKVLELIAWLALHPEGGSPERIAAALWPDASYSGGSFRTYRWDARRALGDDPHGEALLSDYADLRLSDAVSTDWARFRALAASNDRADQHAALALVRGKALGEVDWLWLTMEGIVSSIEAEVSDLAVALASEELDRGDFQAALHAADQGLLAAPYDERLHRAVMKAHYGAGNPAGVRAAMHRLTSLLEEDVEPVESMHDETYRLYQSLTSGVAPSGARSAE